MNSWMLDENSEIDHYLATVLDENRYLPFHCRYFSLERAPLQSAHLLLDRNRFT